MIEAITMPRWGMAMEEGTVTAWHLEEGASVLPGEEIVDVESTKTTNALEARSSGVIRRRLAPPGSVLPVGSLLGVIAPADVPENEIEKFISSFTSAETAVGAESLPRPQLITAGSRQINCLVLGEGNPVLLIHGFGGSIDSWSLTQPGLAVTHRVVAIDLPGHGESDESLNDGGVDELASVIAPVLDVFGFDVVHLIGHSMGGAVAAAAALLNPSRVRSLALIAPAGFGTEIDAGYIEGYLAAKRRRDLRPHVERLFADPELVSERMLEDLLRMKRLGGVEKALRQIAGQLFPGGRLRELLLRERLTELAMPRLILWGDEDRIIPPAHATSLGAITICGAGHMPQLERPAEVNRLLLAHLAQAEGSA
jgi:pyruvate dehydrogenase E2 component (dihydrolipoamide acetyltransferase)